MSQPLQTVRPSLKKRLLRVVVFLVAFYLVSCVIVACFQRQMIYHPPIFTAALADQIGRKANLKRWTNSSGQNIGWKRPSPVQPAQGQLLIVYGNGSWATGCAHYADVIQPIAALDVFVLEYPGYGDRPGSPSQKNLFSAADEAIQLLGTNMLTYILGESLGSGVASYLAGTYPGKVNGVILLSPYNCLTDVAQYHMPMLPVHLLLVDRFPSEDYLKNYQGAVGIMVDGWDEIVPEKFGLRLYLSLIHI